MKLLLVADLHYSLPQFDWLVKEAGQFDLVVIAGDLLDISSVLDPDVQIVVVLRYLKLISQQVPLVVCSGNHDGDAKNEAGEFIAAWLQKARHDRLYVDGDSFEFGGVKITVCPWWDGEITRTKMVAMLDQQSRAAGQTWLWVHHAPPNQSPVSWTGKKDAGDAQVRGLIQRLLPNYVFSGHIHGSPFREGGSWVDHIGDTWVFNPGKQIGPCPTSIVVDLEAQHAHHSSQAGEDDRELR
jgi:Icc-related predicted phosphoesterase